MTPMNPESRKILVGSSIVHFECRKSSLGSILKGKGFKGLASEGGNDDDNDGTPTA